MKDELRRNHLLISYLFLSLVNLLMYLYTQELVYIGSSTFFVIITLLELRIALISLYRAQADMLHASDLLKTTTEIYCLTCNIRYRPERNGVSVINTDYNKQASMDIKKCPVCGHEILAGGCVFHKIKYKFKDKIYVRTN